MTPTERVAAGIAARRAETSRPFRLTDIDPNTLRTTHITPPPIPGAIQRAVAAEMTRIEQDYAADALRYAFGSWPRPNRNPMPTIVLFPRVERLEVAARDWTRRIRAAIDCLTGRMDLELGYDDDGWD